MVDQTTNQARRVYVVNGPAAGTPTGATGSAGQADVAAPIEQARQYLYQGGLWVPANAKANGWQGMALVRSSDGQEIFTGPMDVTTTPADNAGNVYRSLPVVSFAELWNNAGYDKQRGNTEGTLLASAARTATTISATQTNHNARGVEVALDVTANPGGAETLTISLHSLDQLTGALSPSMAQLVSSAASNGHYVLQMYPGVQAALYAGGGAGKSVPLALPRSWVCRVIHSAAGSWTYTLTFATIV